MTEPEIKALQQAHSVQEAAQLLGQFQQARLETGRLPEPSPPSAGKALINQALTRDEQVRHGLQPTAAELDYTRAAGPAQEPERANEFVAQRKTLNANWFLDPVNTAQVQERLAQERTGSYWYERDLGASASAQRDARTEKTDRRLSMSEIKALMEQRRESEREHGHDHSHSGQGRDSGGRGGRGE